MDQDEVTEPGDRPTPPIKFGVVYDHAEQHREVDGPYETVELARASYESEYGDALLVEMPPILQLLENDEGHPHGAYAVGRILETLSAQSPG